MNKCNPMNLQEHKWYDPINKQANVNRKLSYYIGYYSVVQCKVINVDGLKYDDFRDCLDVIPDNDENLIVRKNDDFTETVIFKWNMKHNLWFNVFNYTLNVV